MTGCEKVSHDCPRHADLDNTYKDIALKMFDYDKIGQHDYMGQVREALL